MRIEMESAKGRLRTAEEDNAHKQALISHNNHQVRPWPPRQRNSSDTEKCKTYLQAALCFSE